MNPRRYQILFNAQTEVAKKVLMAVSSEHTCSSREVYRALVDAGSSVSNFQVIEGCLNSLQRQKLLKEPHPGRFIRILPNNYSINPSQGTEDSSDDDTIEAPVVEPTEESLDATIEKIRPTSADVLPFPDPTVPCHEVVVPVSYESDSELEYYFNRRYERVVMMLKLLSEKVSDEVGLALLDVAEELDNNHAEQLEYFHNLSITEERHLEMHPGWYQHDLDGCTRFSRQKELTPEHIEELRKSKKDGSDRFILVGMEEMLKMINEGMSPEQLDAYDKSRGASTTDEIFQKFEGNGPEMSYYRSIMERVKENVPDIEPVVDVVADANESIPEIRKERKNRRGLCDMKIHGISQAPEYRAWMGVLSSANVKAMEAEGLEIHQPWLNSFRTFLDDVGYRPSFDAKLRRKDLTVGWIPSNVMWRVRGTTLPSLSHPPQGWPLLAEEARAIRQARRENKNADRKIGVRRHGKAGCTDVIE